MKRIAGTAVAISLLILISSTLLAQGFPNLPQSKDSKTNNSTQAQVILEVSIFCTGMCHRQKGNIDSLRLYEDMTAEYRIVSSERYVPDKDDEVLLSKRIVLNPAEFNELMTLAESPGFLNSETGYDSKKNFVDAQYTTTLIYKKAGIRKTVTLRNYVPNKKEDSPPAELRDIVHKAYELISRMSKIK